MGFNVHLHWYARCAHLNEPLAPVMVLVQLDVERLEGLHDRVPGPDRPWACLRVLTGLHGRLGSTIQALVHIQVHSTHPSRDWFCLLRRREEGEVGAAARCRPEPVLLRYFQTSP